MLSVPSISKIACSIALVPPLFTIPIRAIVLGVGHTSSCPSISLIRVSLHPYRVLGHDTPSTLTRRQSSSRTTPWNPGPSSITARQAQNDNDSNDDNDETKSGYGFEEYTTKRSTFEPMTTSMSTSTSTSTPEFRGPWPNYYCAPDLHRTPPSSILQDEQELQSLLTSSQSRFILIWKGQNLIQSNSQQHSSTTTSPSTTTTAPLGIHTSLETKAVFLPYDKNILQPLLSHPDSILCHIGTMNDLHYFALDISFMEHDPTTSFTTLVPSDNTTLSFQQLRSIGGTLTNDMEASLLATSRGLCVWHRSTLHCIRCGNQMKPQKIGSSRKCTSCHASTYPRIDPSMIALIQDVSQTHVLLGRKSNWPPGRYSVLAGFTELGESLEESVIREVWEESGVKVNPMSLAFFGSQPWPFPRSLMIGFIGTAAVVGESNHLPDIVMDEKEMEDVQWFSREQVQRAIFGIDKDENKDNTDLNIPGRASLAYKMLWSWIQNKV